MLLRYAILGLLDGRELHGYRIKSAFEEQIGPFWSLNFGQIYQTLKDLRRRGLIEGRFDQGTGHVGRWMYTITAKGRRALETWLSRSPRRPQPVRDEIFIRLLVVGHKELAPRLRQLATQADVYREYVSHLAGQRGADDPEIADEHLLKTLAADAARFQAEAHLRWLEHCTTLLERSQPSGGGAVTVNGTHVSPNVRPPVEPRRAKAATRC